MSPSYLDLLATGELDRRVERLRSLLEACTLCPHACRVNRLAGRIGRCRAPLMPVVARHTPHHGEEPVLSGTRGSGTLFFSYCHLSCIYCQNWQISQEGLGRPMDVRALARCMLELQEWGCHNLNWVSPTHFLPQAVEALALAAREGLRLPLVYNCSGWESVEVLKLLDGVVDIYLPDARYTDDALAKDLSGAKDYTAINRAALQEMLRQVGHLGIDENGLARRGLIVRHLVLPGAIDSSIATLRRLRRDLGRKVAVGIMSQYHPAWKARTRPGLDRRITREEYARVVEEAEHLEFENGWTQDWAGIDGSWLPDFEKSDSWR